jgi:hypothetical protein
VLDRSHLFDEIIQGNDKPIEFKVNGKKHNRAYYLSHGIYPDWPVFVKTIEQPIGRKKKLYATMPESIQKDVERCFGVLQERFCILSMPCMLWNKDAMHTVMKACIILHNMIIEDEWEDPQLNNVFLFENKILYGLMTRLKKGLRPWMKWMTE